MSGSKDARRWRPSLRLLALCAAVVSLGADAATARPRPTTRPRPRRGAPTHANVKYGPYARNVLDFWRADTAESAPVLICFHGGGFVAGDKRAYARAARLYVPLGISVVSANYRFVRGPGSSPFPGTMHDGARVVQFVRHQAAAWNVDPKRIALTGGSAGACMAIWIALHDDLADPDSDDPVARQSSRVTCVVSHNGQTFVDPRLILKHIGGSPRIHPSLLAGFAAKTAADLEKPAFRKQIEAASAINHATKDDPPLLLIYGGRLDDAPLPATASINKSIHHPMFGKVLKDTLDPLGVACLLYHRDHRPPRGAETAFLKKHLKIAD